jgi:hypothetical protein
MQHTKLEILCKAHNQQGGTIHEFSKQYNVDFLSQTNREFFKTLYGIELKKAHKQNRDEYVWPAEEFLKVFERMCNAFDTGSYSKDSKAIKNTCKLLGIKHTYKAIDAFLKGGAE